MGAPDLDVVQASHCNLLVHSSATQPLCVSPRGAQSLELISSSPSHFQPRKCLQMCRAKEIDTSLYDHILRDIVLFATLTFFFQSDLV